MLKGKKNHFILSLLILYTQEIKINPACWAIFCSSTFLSTVTSWWSTSSPFLMKKKVGMLLMFHSATTSLASSMSTFKKRSFESWVPLPTHYQNGSGRFLLQANVTKLDMTRIKAENFRTLKKTWITERNAIHSDQLLSYA